MPLNVTNPDFPAPYVRETRIDDPIMKRVNVEKAEIGSRTSGLPKDIKNGNSLEHVGGSAGSR